MKKSDFRHSKISVGFAFILVGLLLIFYKPPLTSLSSSESQTFATEPVRLFGFDYESEEDVNIPERVIIPSVSIDIAVGKANIVNGYWEVLNDKAAWGVGSGIPGKGGNQVIFAHAREGLFLPLRKVTVDDRVYVLAGEDWYLYKVEEIKEVNPDQIEVIAPTDDETLTLYTCSGFQDAKRLILIAKRAS